MCDNPSPLARIPLPTNPGSRGALARQILLILLLPAFILGVSAQTGSDPNEGSKLEYDSANSIWRFKWWGREGRTYFIQYSEDLGEPWQWLPLIETGGDSIIELGVTTTADRFFLRLKCSDIATSDPEGSDFDGDTISNIDEILQGLSPFSPDSDGDGMPDGYEVSSGLDPLSGDGAMDPDADGASSITEYLAGRNPNASDSESTPSFVATGLRVFTPLE